MGQIFDFKRLVMVNRIYGDCMEFMAKTADKAYNWVIADVPYGINVGKMSYLKEMSTAVKQKNGTKLNGNKNKTPYLQKDWDSEPPPQKYFDEVRRVSNNQIIFGVEYVDWQGLGNGRIRWDKGVAEGVSFKKYEMAYCSSIDYTYELPLLWAGMCQAKSLKEPMTQQGNKKLNEKRIHPTQKSVLLYSKLLQVFAKKGDKILDTHGGSFSHAIAAEKMGYDLDIIEIDEYYFMRGENRYLKETAMPLFT